MNSYEIVDYNMTEDDKKLAKEYNDLTVKIKKLDLELGTEKRKKLKNIEKIDDIEKQIIYHIFARNKVSDKLYRTKEA